MSAQSEDNSGQSGSSLHGDDPRWLFAPDLLNAPDLRDRLEKPRRQLDSYALYISSHVELEGQYIEPSPSPSPHLQAQVDSPLEDNDDMQMLSPDEVHDSNLRYRQRMMDTPEEPNSIPLQSIEPPNTCHHHHHHHHQTSYSSKIVPKLDTSFESRSPTWVSENDQLPTPKSLSRSSTLVDGERQLMEEALLTSKYRKSRNSKRKTVKKGRTKSMIKTDTKNTKVVKRNSSKASTHPMVTRLKARYNYGALQ
ncbi:MAG: hypothetical protein Q9160_005545 [Pyrenula sp. 1 TL-2023]